MPAKALKPHQLAFLGAVFISLLGYVVVPVHWVLMPLQLLNTHLHEFCHALTAVVTGGEVESIKVFENGSGVTPVGTTSGISYALVACAGYVGASIIGAIVIYIGRSTAGARWMLRVLAVLLGLSMVLWVRGDGVGIASGAFWVFALFGLSFLRGNTILFVAELIGLQQCMNAVRSLYTLLDVSAFSDRSSDAQLMASSTHIPALFWALTWCGFSLVVIGLTVRRAWTSPTPRV